MSSSKVVKAKADPVVVSNSETQKATMAHFRSTCHSLEGHLPVALHDRADEGFFRRSHSLISPPVSSMAPGLTSAARRRT